MQKERLTAFSDGVIAIIITIMVLEMKAPHSADLAALVKLWPVFVSYVLSFVYIAIYWNNHHHLLATADHVTGGVLWANMHLLFWMSLIPFATAWMGENQFARLPTALYGVTLLGPAVAYFILQHYILRAHGPHSVLARALGADLKGKASVVAYLCAIPLAFVHQALAAVIYVGVALIWLVPDRRIERTLHDVEHKRGKAP